MTKEQSSSQSHKQRTISHMAMNFASRQFIKGRLQKEKSRQKSTWQTTTWKNSKHSTCTKIRC